MNDRVVDKGIKLAVEAVGGWRSLGRKLGMNYQTIQSWKQIPAKHIVEIEKATGIPREKLRPELYRRSSKVVVELDTAKREILVRYITRLQELNEKYDGDFPAHSVKVMQSLLTTSRGDAERKQIQRLIIEAKHLFDLPR